MVFVGVNEPVVMSGSAEQYDSPGRHQVFTARVAVV